MTGIEQAYLAHAGFEHVRPYYPAVIGGEELGNESGPSLPLVDPRTGQQFSRSTRGGAAEIDLAVEAAGLAGAGWREWSALDRGRALNTLGRLVRRDRERLAALESLNTGRKQSECLGDIEGSAQYFEFYGGLAAGVEGAVFESTRGRTFSYQVHEPYGVTGHIIPWNSPLLLAARSFAPALATGNSVVAKTADETPITTIELERLAREAGIPPGVINVVPGLGIEAGAALAAHPDVPRLTFTGSTQTGRVIQVAAAARMCHVTLELGGKSAHIVFSDADIPAALEAAERAILVQSGQACVAGSRLLVARDIHEEFTAKLATRFRTAARPDDAGQRIAPLISQRQQTRVLDYIERGAAEGGQLLTEGPDASQPGFYVPPTLFDNVRPEMSIFQEEIFGPVLAVTAFDSDDEAVALANNTMYGLAAGMWTSSVSRIHRLVPRLEAGMVYVNGYLNAGIESPIGGFKLSGLGHEKGRMAMTEYTRSKSVSISY